MAKTINVVKITNVVKESVDTNKLRYFGLGLGYRREIRKDIIDYLAKPIPQTFIQWLEIVPENYIYKGGFPRKQFEKLMNMGVPLIPHGVNLSIGTAHKDKKRPNYDFHLLRGLKDLFEEIKAPWFSDHLSCSRIDNHYFQELIPVPFTKEAVDVVSDNIKFLEDYFQLPFLFENPSYYSHIIKPEMRESTFINAVLKKAKCGLLLDVNNVFVNSVNHRYLPKQFIDDLDLSKVVQVHMAGHRKGYKSKLANHEIKILDTHGENMSERVLELFVHLMSKTRPKAVLLERDSNFDAEGFEGLLDELRKLRDIMDSRLDNLLAKNIDENKDTTEAKPVTAELNTNPEQSGPESSNPENNSNSIPETVLTEQSNTTEQSAAGANTKVKTETEKRLEQDIDSLGEEFMDL